MAPIKTYSNWNKASNNARIEPYRRYYFICEGKNTEQWYFEKLIDILKTYFVKKLKCVQKQTIKLESWQTTSGLQ